MVKIISDWSNINKSQNARSMKSVLVSSNPDSNDCFEVALVILEKIFKKKVLILKAVGLPENVKDVMSTVESDNAHYFQGDANKFFVRRYPEYVAEIDRNQLLQLFCDGWSNAVCERRYIYILEESNVYTFMNELKNSAYSNGVLNEAQWQYVDAVIENVPEFGSDTAIVFSCKENDWGLLWDTIQENEYQ